MIIIASQGAPTILVFSVFLDFLQEEIEKIKDPRSESNGTKYKISDAMLSAFSLFFMQCQSFLEHQRQMQSRSGKDNAQSIFGVKKISEGFGKALSEIFKSGNELKRAYEQQFQIQKVANNTDISN